VSDPEETAEDAAAREIANYLDNQTLQHSGASPAPKAKPVPVTEPAEETRASADIVPIPPVGSPEREEKKRSKKKGGKPPPPREFKRLPADCPVKPLGLNGDIYSFLDANGQLIERNAGWLTQIGVDALFSDEKSRVWLEENYPRIGEGGRVSGIDRESIRASLMVACGELSKRGVFQARERVRGSGAWADADTLVLHVGDAVQFYARGGKVKEVPLGMHDGFVYPLGQAQPRPSLAADARDGDDSPAVEVLELFKKWNWARGDLDAALLLGWVCCAIIGGALSWRPAGWITGSPGSGKSTLQEIIWSLLGGDQAFIGASDSSGAGVWQSMERMSLPAVVDEVEADADNAKKKGIVDLMIQAASGGLIRRGGSDHRPVVFRVRSCFLFASVLQLPLPPAAKSRLCHFEALPLKEGTKPPAIDFEAIAALGQRLRGRIVKNWPRWKEHLLPWWEAINDGVGKQGQRAADTYGTLLAMQHMVSFDDPAEETMLEEHLKGLIPYLKLLADQQGGDQEQMMQRLCSKSVKVEDKEMRTEAPMRALIYIASGRVRFQDVKPNDPDSDMMLPDVSEQVARRVLSRWGLSVVNVRTAPEEPGDLAIGQYLGVALQHTELAKVFYGTKWQDGVWVQSCGRFAGAGKRKVRLDQSSQWAVCVPIDHVLGAREGEKASTEETGNGQEVIG